VTRSGGFFQCRRRVPFFTELLVTVGSPKYIERISFRNRTLVLSVRSPLGSMLTPVPSCPASPTFFSSPLPPMTQSQFPPLSFERCPAPSFFHPTSPSGPPHVSPLCLYADRIYLHFWRSPRKRRCDFFSRSPFFLRSRARWIVFTILSIPPPPPLHVPRGVSLTRH